MVKSRLLLIPRAPFPQVVQLIPKLKGPVPSPLKVPVFACNVLSSKRLNDADVPYHNASSVEFEELEVRRPRLRPRNGIRRAISQIYHDMHIRPNLGDVHSAKRRGTTTARAVV